MSLLLLTSTGLSSSNIFYFFEHWSKLHHLKNAGIIVNAAKGLEENKYAKLAKTQLQKIGYERVDFIDLLNTNPSHLMEYETIYVCGGNTYHLLSAIQESKAQPVLSEIIMSPNPIAYIGVSAGSAVCSPSIDYMISDANDISLQDLKGLNVINAAVIPHFQDSDREFAISLQSKYERVICLRDGEGLARENNHEVLLQC